MSHFYRAKMPTYLESSNDTESPSMSRNEDNLSNSDGPLLKRSLGKNNMAVSSQNVCGTKTILSKRPSTISCRHNSTSLFESTEKRYCLWALTLILAIAGLCNLLLSITVMAVLRVGQGMEAMEVIAGESLVKFYGRTDLDRVSIRDGICEGYGDEPVEFAGDGAGVQLMVQNRRHSAKANLHVFHNGTAFSSVESFEIVDPRTGNSSFSTNFPNFGLPSGVEKLAVKLAETHRIVSPVNTSLTFDSDREITVHGAESTTMESKAIIWMADNDVRVKSNRSIVLVAPRGIYLDTMRLALAPTYHRSDAGVEAMQYKICICMPQGKLFRVPILSAASAVRVNCARIGVTSEHDPCA